MAGRARHMMSIAEESLADVVLPPKDGFERRIVKEPLGVVLDLPAWNYPLLTAVNVLVPAVLAGNAVVVKHSPRSPALRRALRARVRRRPARPAALVQALDCDHPTSEAHRRRPARRPRRLHGLDLRRPPHPAGRGAERSSTSASSSAATTRRTSPPTATSTRPSRTSSTAPSTTRGRAAARSSASTCTARSTGASSPLAEPLVRAYVMGDPMDAKTTLGPIAQPDHVPSSRRWSHDAQAQGRALVAGGKRGQRSTGSGRFFEATLARATCTQAMKLMQQESFGPDPPGHRRSTRTRRRSRKMNDSPLGLTASVWTRDRERAARMARGARVRHRLHEPLRRARPGAAVERAGRTRAAA